MSGVFSFLSERLALTPVMVSQLITYLRQWLELQETLSDQATVSNTSCLHPREDFHMGSQNVNTPHIILSQLESAEELQEDTNLIMFFSRIAMPLPTFSHPERALVFSNLFSITAQCASTCWPDILRSFGFPVDHWAEVQDRAAFIAKDERWRGGDHADEYSWDNTRPIDGARCILVG